MMTSRVTVIVHCDACPKTATLTYDDADKSSTLDNITWRAVRDLVLTSTWFRVQFPDSLMLRDYHVCSTRCAETMIERQYQAKKSDVESN